MHQEQDYSNLVIKSYFRNKMTGSYPQVKSFTLELYLRLLPQRTLTSSSEDSTCPSVFLQNTCLQRKEDNIEQVQRFSSTRDNIIEQVNLDYFLQK